MTATILLLRHPESLHNKTKRWAGFIDSPLTDIGRQHAVDAAHRLSPGPWNSIGSSDLQRARESATIIARLRNLSLLPADPRWRERCAGQWQGKITQTLGDDPAYQQWVLDKNSQIPGGETGEQFRNRILAALKDTLAWSQLKGGTIIVAHDGVQQVVADALNIEGYPWKPLEGPFIYHM